LATSSSRSRMSSAPRWMSASALCQSTIIEYLVILIDFLN
jgi:hypothetical protein